MRDAPAPVMAFLTEDYEGQGVSTALDLMVAHDDGSLTGPLDPRDTYAFDPAVSPDGTLIAFGAQTSLSVPGGRVTRHSIFLVRPDGSELVPIYSTKDAIVTEPRWAPDGTRIMFSYIPLVNGSRENAGNNDLWILERDPAGVTWQARPFITRRGPELGADFSPDGERIVYSYMYDDDRMNDFEKWNPPAALWIAPADGSSKGRRITPFNGWADDPAFSPDGKMIVYIDGEAGWKIRIIRPDGTRARTLLDTLFIWDPEFTADGREVAYAVQGPDRRDGRILAVGLDGSRRVVIDLPGADSSPSFFPAP